MKVLVILALVAHLSCGNVILNNDLDVFGIGGGIGDKFVTTNIRAKDIDNFNKFGDDKDINVVNICNVRGFGLYQVFNLDFDNLNDMNDCLVLHIKGMKKHTNHAVVVLIKDTDPLLEIRKNILIHDDVVLVTVHKKLGSYTRRDINDDDIVGIVDVKDTIGALKWIQMNIHKFGGDADQVVLTCNHITLGICNVLRNTYHNGNLFREVMLHTGINNNDVFTQDLLYGGKLNDITLGGVTHGFGINNILRNQLLTRTGGYGLNDITLGNVNTRFGINNQDLFTNNILRNQLLTKRNLFNLYDNNWGLTNTLKNDLYLNKYYGGNDYQWNKLDNGLGLNYGRGFKTYGINDNIWNVLGNQGQWRGYGTTLGGVGDVNFRLNDIRCRQFGIC